MKNYRVLVSCIIDMEFQAEDTADARKTMDEILDRMQPYTKVNIKGFNIEEIEEDTEKVEE